MPGVYGMDKSWKEFIDKMCDRNNSSSVTRMNDNGRFLSGHTVMIIDDNLPLRSMRYEYYQIARRASIGFCEVFVTCELKTALEWNEERTLPVPSSTIVAMATTIEPPEPNKHHWERTSVVLKSDSWWDGGGKWKEICSEVYQLCDHALKNPMKPLTMEDTKMKEESRQITRDSLIHQVDQKLRECVSSAIQRHTVAGTGRNIKEEAKIVNGLRKKILEEFRSSEIPLQLKDSETDLIKLVEDRFIALYLNS